MPIRIHRRSCWTPIRGSSAAGRSPATPPNLLAAAWIQFEVHDWFSHGKGDPENPWQIPLEASDPWPAERPMQIFRTQRDPSATAGPPAFKTADTHWWDASRIYGDDPAYAQLIRSGEKG